MALTFYQKFRSRGQLQVQFTSVAIVLESENNRYTEL